MKNEKESPDYPGPSFVEFMIKVILVVLVIGFVIVYIDLLLNGP